MTRSSEYISGDAVVVENHQDSNKSHYNSSQTIYEIEEEFDSMDISGAVDIEYTYGSSGDIIAEGSAERIEKLQVYVSGNTLYVKEKLSFSDLRNSYVKLYISSEHLENLKVSGTSKFRSTTTISEDNFFLNASGCADIKIDVNSIESEVQVSGASSVDISGYIENISYEVSGASDVDLDVDSVSAKIYVSGASSVDISGNIETSEYKVSGASDVDAEIHGNYVDAHLSGSSSLELSGEVEEAIYDIQGASDLDADDLICMTVTISASGASDAKVYATETLDATSSGGSDIKYKGDPSLTSNTSGAGTIEKDN